MSRGILCTTLVAAMISSAGSLSKSNALIERQMSSVNGQVSIRANVLRVIQVELDATQFEEFSDFLKNDCGNAPGFVSRRDGFPDTSFDLVIAGQCWFWFDRPSAAREARRIVKPGGRLVIAFRWIPLLQTSPT